MQASPCKIIFFVFWVLQVIMNNLLKEAKCWKWMEVGTLAHPRSEENHSLRQWTFSKERTSSVSGSWRLFSSFHHHYHHLTRIFSFSSSALENRTKIGKSQNPASDPKMTSLTTILMSTVPTLMATSGKNVHNLLCRVRSQADWKLNQKRSILELLSRDNR